MHSLTREILEHLAESGKLMLGAFFPKHVSYAQSGRIIFGLDRSNSPRHVEKPTLSSILWRLKKDGLVAHAGTKRNMLWKITTNGRRYLKENRPRIYRQPPKVLPAADGVYRLVTFDVPEKERKKRRWLRKELLACGFDALHKSVFLGDRPLPEEFIKQLDLMRLNSYVHVISIEKLGTIPRKTK